MLAAALAGRCRAAAHDTTDPVAGLVDAMERHGFEPTAKRRGNQVEIVLGACPFATTALADPETVCGLHLGLAHGAAEQLGGIVIDELVPRDPVAGPAAYGVTSHHDRPDGHAR